MERVRGALAAVMLAGMFSCGENRSVESDAALGNANADGDEADAGAQQDASGVNASDSGSRDASSSPNNPNQSTDAGGPRDSGSARDVTTLPPANCGMAAFHTGSTIPDMLIVLDRSGSMRPDTIPAGLRCDNIDPFDLATALSCAGAGIDCTTMEWQDTTYCGGTRMAGPVDRWDPSVTALKQLTTAYDTNVAFGLMTFPAAGRADCNPGRIDVPLDTGKAMDIAQVLDNTTPGGGTPTGESLQAALQTFQSMSIAADQASASAQYVLLVTDGQPTCPNADGRLTDSNGLAKDMQLTLDALDALMAAGIKTFVVGYDADLDPQFASALTEFAQHGGTDHYFPVSDQASLVNAFQSVTATVISCDFKFDEPVDDPSYLLVKLDGDPLKPNDANGWSFANNTVTVQGDACTTLQQGRGHRVEITLECVPPVIM